ncbi:MAG: sugar phosphate nucleotidyltransferase [Candidatus Omnitrophota bacterium]
MRTVNIKKELKNVYAVILVGGRGKRFWPVSRLTRPKPFLKIAGQKKTLIAETFERAKAIVSKENIVFVANVRHVSAIKKEFPRVRDANIIREPVGRNTTAAIALAAAVLKKRNRACIMAVMPADQLIPDRSEFRDTLRDAVIAVCRENALVLFGLRPRYPSTEFGYIKKGKRIVLRSYRSKRSITKVLSFTEKPDAEGAKRFLRSGNYLWNSGIFVWRAETILDNIRRYEPSIGKGIDEIARTIGTKDFQSQLRKRFSRLNNISIDYSVLQRSRQTVCIESDFSWQDVGSWNNMENLFDRDRSGNISLGECVLHNTGNSIAMSDEGHLIGLCGVSEVVVIRSKNATLVCKKDAAHEVRHLVEKIEKNIKYRKYL